MAVSDRLDEYPTQLLPTPSGDLLAPMGPAALVGSSPQPGVADQMLD